MRKEEEKTGRLLEVRFVDATGGLGGKGIFSSKSDIWPVLKYHLMPGGNALVCAELRAFNKSIMEGLKSCVDETAGLS